MEIVMLGIVQKITQRVSGFTQKRWKLLVVALVVVGIGFWIYQGQETADPELTFVRPEQRELVAVLDVSGIVDAREKSRLRFMAGGKVVYLGAQEGDEVRRGQTLATIDRATLQKQLQQTLNAYQRERNSWDQFEDDFYDVTVDDEDRRARDNSQLRLNDSVLQVEQQTIAIQNTVLSAPFAGILTYSPTVVAGVTLSPSDYFEIVNPSSIYFRAAIDEADIAKIQLGQRALLVLDAFPDTTLAALVEKIAFTSSESATGTVFLVDFSLDLEETSLLLRLGMNGDIAIELDRRPSVLSIPINATRERDGVVFVDVRTGEFTYEEREVRVGLSTEEWVEVLSGISESDEVFLPY
jgi:macrolide-specific efflux system membrane fusion protein